ncbi:hypothetical protein [Kitasatospora sp. NPDC006786]|uniref:hypothetical protein n=1 Tax=unclassified Kitasatospora TaxID=2633591 RepID=UPI00340FF090
MTAPDRRPLRRPTPDTPDLSVDLPADQPGPYARLTAVERAQIPDPAPADTPAQQPAPGRRPLGPGGLAVAKT